MSKLTLVLPSLLLLLVPAVAMADQHSPQGPKVDIKINTHSETNEKEDHNLSIHNTLVATGSPKLRFAETGDLFDIRGTIDSVGTGQFSVGGHLIMIDPSKTGRYNQKGDLEVGAFARVNGKIIDGEHFATEVKIEAQGKLGHPPTRISIHFPTASGSATHSATPSASIRIRGPIDQVIQVLANILSFLKNLI